MLKIVFYIELFWLLIDSISGYLLNNDIIFPGNQSVGSLIRIFVFIFFLLILFKYVPVTHDVPLFLLVLTILMAFIHSLYFSTSNVINDFQFGSKIILPILFYYVIRLQIHFRYLNEQRLKLVVYFNSFVLLGNVLLAFWGIGFGNYGVDEYGNMLGGKGFFYAGNEVNGALLALYCLVLILFFTADKKKYFVITIISFIFLIASIILLSKTSIVGFIIISFYIFATSFKKTRAIQIAFSIALAVGITYPLWINFLLAAIDRWTYFMNLSSGFVDFATSGRSLRVESFFELYKENSPTLLLWGGGWMGIQSVGFENDALDMLISFGIVGIIIYAIWIGWAVSNFKKYLKARNQSARNAAFSIFLFLMISITAGHVMYSAMIAPFIASLACISSLPKGRATTMTASRVYET